MTNGPETSPLWPADSPAATAHITMLQGIINRLANNSASCKTWCLALVSALLSLAGATHMPSMVVIALVPVAIFGFLDSMYLAQEKAYRILFNTIATSIRTRQYAIANVFEAKAPLTLGDFFGAIASWSVFPVYLGLLVAYGVAEYNGWLSFIGSAAK